MKRRELLLGTCALLAAQSWTRAERAFRVGVLISGDSNNADVQRLLDAFRAGMKERGYEEGGNLQLAVRHYGSDPAKIAAFADELIVWQADVLVANISSTAVVLKKRTTTIPIVMVTAVDAVKEGLVVSLARPGGNVTGMTSLGAAMHGKLVELTRDLLPRARRIAILINPDHALSKSYEAAAVRAARSRSLETTLLRVRGRDDLQEFGRQLTVLRPDALVIATDGVLYGLRNSIVQAAFERRVPAIALLPEFIESGAVATLGWDLAGNYRDAARYVDRILKGAKPSDLPIAQPTQFQLLVNMKSAKDLGIRVPQTVLARADRVIE